MSTENKPEENKEVNLEELKAQIDNLNKGIAKYRDEAKSIREESAKQIKAVRDDYEGKISKLTASKASDEELPELNAEDQKRLEKWAKTHGFVTKAEMEEKQNEMQRASIQSIEKQAIEEFLEKYPEYKEDEQWEKLKSEFSIYKQPTTIDEYRKLLRKSHIELNPDDSRARAELQSKSRLSLGGRSQAGNEPSDAISKLQEKYPNLSRAQIESRLGELKTLFPDKK